MQKCTTVQTNEQKNGKELLNDFLVGEVNVLWKMLGTTTPASARARLLRDSAEAIKAAKKIIATRKKLIEDFKK